jgi:hypothetical protein
MRELQLAFMSSKLAWSCTSKPLARKANVHNKMSQQHGCGEVFEVGEKLNVL